MSDKPEFSAFEIWLREQCFDKPTSEAYSLAWTAWQKRADLAKPSEWISVDDLLPEYHKNILVCGGSCGDLQMVATLQNVTRSIAKNSPKDKRWFAVPGWGHELRPTHWQPLPSPPTRETP